MAEPHHGANYRHGPLGSRPGRARGPAALRQPALSAICRMPVIMPQSEHVVPVRFHLLAEASPGLLPRLMQPFAKRDLVPDHVAVRRDGTLLRVELAMEAMPAGMVHLVAGNLGQVVGVTELRGGRDLPNGLAA